MIPAALGLLGGGWLAVYVLWPLEMRLEKRHLRRLADEVGRLEADLRGR